MEVYQPPGNIRYSVRPRRLEVRCPSTNGVRVGLSTAYATGTAYPEGRSNVQRNGPLGIPEKHNVCTSHNDAGEWIIEPRRTVGEV